MAKWASPALLDGGLDYFAASATKQVLVKAYASNDSYATVVANTCASVNMVPADFTKSSNVSGDRVLTIAAKPGASITANSGANPNLHFVFTNGVDAVIYVTDETTDQQVYAGNTGNMPSHTYLAAQPVSP